MGSFNFSITAEDEYNKVSIERNIEKLEDLYDVFEQIALSLQYHPESIRRFIKETADEYYQEDKEKEDRCRCGAARIQEDKTVL